MRDGGTAVPGGIGRALLTNRLARAGEILAVVAFALVVILAGLPFAGEDPIRRQVVVWFANIGMLVVIWLGLRVRGQGWSHFGLTFRPGGRRAVVRAILQSLIVFVVALAAFVLGAIVMANIVGVPEGADMGGYDYLRGNLPMLILALVAVYISASFGEEVIYRGFLINRVAEMGSGGKWAWRAAVAISAVVFGLIHYDWGLIGIVETAFMGLALAISYLRVQRNLWVTILAHGYMDTILMLQMYLGAGPAGS